jgi:hypothetical protein
MSRPVYCIYVDTICQGPIPVERDELGKPVTYNTLLEAQREIADWIMHRLEQFLAGEREFEEAAFVEEYVVAADLLDDGSIVDEHDRLFGPGDGASRPTGMN